MGSSKKLQTHLLSLLLKLFDRPLIDASTLINKETSCGGLARVHMADDDYVDMNLFLAHFTPVVGTLKQNFIFEAPNRRTDK